MLWSRLAAELSEVELIELCLLIGHYEMLAMTLESLAWLQIGRGAERR